MSAIRHAPPTSDHLIAAALKFVWNISNRYAESARAQLLYQQSDEWGNDPA
jgi:hypothetical protein